MTLWSRCLLLCLVSAPALCAAAPAASEDDLTRLLADRGLISRLEQVGAQVRDRTAELVLNAVSLMGVPYRRGGTQADAGFDCSGFVRTVYAQSIGLLLPRQARDQAAATEEISRSELQPGDLVFFNTMRRAFSHVGIYVGDGRFVHAPKPGQEVRIDSMQSSYWQRRFDGARRVVASAGGPQINVPDSGASTAARTRPEPAAAQDRSRTP